MDKVARLSSSQRQELFSETAARMNLLPGLVEKDFWVCWVLKHLFSVPAFKSRILFKGGTTLSKVFGVIRRFSEDIDLAVDFEMLGFVGERSPLQDLSSKQLRRRLDEMRKACERYVATEFVGVLSRQVEERFTSGQSWQLSVDPADGQVVNFYYPLTGNETPYIRPMVRLELGTRGALIPNNWYTIKPYAADHFPAVFEDASCVVQAIRATRTFWEKATILHQEHHRTEAHGPPDRLSRHYYDVFMLSRNEAIRREALGDLSLLHQVVEHKRRFFRSAWARYDLAVPATIRLGPSPAWSDFLRRDYEKMGIMLFGDAPSFDEILKGLEELERAIGGAGK